VRPACRRAGPGWAGGRDLGGGEGGAGGRSPAALRQPQPPAGCVGTRVSRVEAPAGGPETSRRPGRDGLTAAAPVAAGLGSGRRARRECYGECAAGVLGRVCVGSVRESVRRECWGKCAAGVLERVCNRFGFGSGGRTGVGPATRAARCLDAYPSHQRF
jgi:hypothetical protein